MTVRSSLEFSARLRGLDKNRIKTRTEEVANICHLEEYIDVLIGKLSKGFRQRVGLAQTIIHEPEVLILDELTIGIDPIQVAMTRQLIKELGKERTILLSTHILPEISMTCERVIIINKGRIIAEDRIENLSSLMSGSRRIRLEVQGPYEEVVNHLRKIEGVIQVSFNGSHYIVECAAGQDFRGKITQTIVQGGWTLLSMESIEMSLEDIFLKLTTEEETSQ
jgi:ABC-2 type transport system ATP-binding protein